MEQADFLNTKRLLAITLALFAANQLLQWAVLLLSDKHWLDFCHSDCYWYLGVMEGYDHAPAGNARKDAADWAFFPLFPLISQAIALVMPQDPRIAILVSSKIGFFLAIFAFIRFSQVWDSRINPWVAGLALAVNPYSLYANSGYSEPWYLLLTTLAFHSLHRQKYATSGAVGALLSATRPVGVIFSIAYLLEVLRQGRQDRDRRLFQLLGLALIPAGLAALMTFLYLRTGDALAFAHIQLGWDRLPGNPLNTLPELDIYHGAQLAFAALAMIWLAARGHYPLAVFALLSTLIPLSTGLWAIPRYLWWQLPMLLVLAQLINYRRIWLPYSALAIAACFYLYRTWLEGAPWWLH